MFISDDYAQPGGTFYARGYIYDTIDRLRPKSTTPISSIWERTDGGFLRMAMESNQACHTTITARLPPESSFVTTICLSIFSFSSATWEMMPTRRLPSVRPARVR